MLRAAPDAERLPVAANGALDSDALRSAVDRERPLIAVQQLNSETGNAQHIGAIAAIVHDAGGLVLTDCAQSAGKLALPDDADMAIVSAHKFGGPVGVGALLVKDFAMLAPAGGQERGYRRGTENLPGAMGMAAALEAAGDPYLAAGVADALGQLADAVRAAGGTWLSDHLAAPTPYIAAIAMPGMSASAQVMRLDMAGIAVSQGSACSSGTMKVSAVLEAMQLDPALAANMIRVSPGWTTTPEEIARLGEVWRDIASSSLRA